MYQRSILLYDDNIGRVDYIDHIGDERRILNAARVSFGKHSDDPVLDFKDQKLLQYLLDHKHTSTLEHNVYTFRFVVPLFVRGQHHRHRTWCLAGDNSLYFDLPGGIKRRGHQLYKLTIQEVFERFESARKRNAIRKMMLRNVEEDTMSLSHTNIVDCWSSGIKSVYRLTLKNGMSIRCSMDHQFLTDQGWMRLEDALNKSAKFCVDYFNREAKKISTPSDGWTIDSEPPADKEDWSSIRGWEGLYEVSNYGRVRSYKTTRGLRETPVLKKQTFNSAGYLVVSFSRDGETVVRTVHTLVAEAFLGAGVADIVCHVEDVKWDNRAKMLKLGSFMSNAMDRKRNGNDPSREVSFFSVEEISYEGEEETYDIEVVGPYHNFICNGFVVHNSFNEISRRYTEFDLEFYEPERFRTQHKSNKQASTLTWFDPTLPMDGGIDASEALKQHTKRSLDFFQMLLEQGVAREMARMVLPQSLYVQYWGTCDLNNLIKFLELRIKPDAQWEIRRVAGAILLMLNDLLPQQLGPLLMERYAPYLEDLSSFVDASQETEVDASQDLNTAEIQVEEPIMLTIVSEPRPKHWKAWLKIGFAWLLLHLFWFFFVYRGK